MANRVAYQLGIPFYVVDARKAFHEHVVTYYLTTLKNGELRTRVGFAIRTYGGAF